MEGEVREMRMELAAIRRDRLDLCNRKETTGIVVTEAEPEEVLKIEQNIPPAAKQYKNVPEETKKFSDEEMAILKAQVRDVREEAEELTITLVEKSEQLQEYRMKYLQAQQQVEELKRQLDIIEFDNKQVSDQIQVEIQKMKMQFQEKLQELAPLPDLLKGAQIQIQEAKQLQRLAEDSSQQLSNELHRVKEKIRQRMQIQINNLQESFELSEIRLRALQNQVTSLKSSYTVVLADNADLNDLNKIVAP